MTRFSTKKKFGTVLATAAVAATMLVLPAQAASACTLAPTKSATKVGISKENDCIGSVDTVQARMQRYYAGTINTYYGAQGTWSSSVSASNGTLANAAYRTKSSISGSWTPYITF